MVTQSVHQKALKRERVKEVTEEGFFVAFDLTVGAKEESSLTSELSLWPKVGIECWSFSAMKWKQQGQSFLSFRKAPTYHWFSWISCCRRRSSWSEEGRAYSQSPFLSFYVLDGTRPTALPLRLASLSFGSSFCSLWTSLPTETRLSSFFHPTSQ